MNLKSNKRINAHIKAFTLVELIVVIVILAILATIAFLSFSSQSSSARDSTRLADGSNISKGLSVHNALSWNYPMPEWPISITASWTQISYQWNAGQNTLNMIKMSGWKDPLDWSYYTYSVNSERTKFEILQFLENPNNIAFNLNPFEKEKANADASSYSGRTILTKWDSIWILLGSWNLVPIQRQYDPLTFTSVDIINSTWSFTAVFNKDTMISWTWSALRALVWWEWLIWYWDMESMTSNWLLKDLSGKWNNGIFTWSILPQAVGAKIGEWLNFSSWVIAIPDPNKLFVENNEMTLFAVAKLDMFTNPFPRIIDVAPSLNVLFTCKNLLLSWSVDQYCTNPDSDLSSFSWLPVWGSFEPWYWILAASNQFMWKSSAVISNKRISNTIQIWTYHTIIWRLKKTKADLFVDGKLIATVIDNNFIPNKSDSSYKYAFLWWNGISSRLRDWNGVIDEVRIYNRAISDTEAAALFNTSK
ncbi:MAG: hypothetical protein ACD_3C00205G0005 [uncultured bacterium (gcode 4)]|uniref:LamG-like jellyroll fold domain-containing protein n=1 Tax=uncultured bacterium (gcode 4) TaxID=1234023 RepID=K2FZW9_9BACT|nr:MAG: hypothetical protein ACD_3C00205G0005 [uncultured bacterium (gcode 4)]